MSNNQNELREELAEAVENGLRSFKEATEAAKTVNPAGFEDPVLGTDAEGKGTKLGTAETPHDAAQNMATIQAKPSDAQGGGAATAEAPEEEEKKEVKETAEYLAQLFDEDELSESFMEKVTTIFEAALQDRIEYIQSEMQESFTRALNEQVETISEDLSEKLDDFLSYVVKEWTEDNQVAIERGIRSDIAESFLSGLKSLFEAHYIEMPDEKVKVVEELYDVNEELEGKLNEQMDRNIELMKALNQTTAKAVFATMCEDLTDTQVERFAQLAETVQFEDYDQYSRKLSIIKESFVGSGNVSDEIVQESSNQVLTEDVSHGTQTDPLMEAYSKAIGFQNRNK